jgi:hypothetical protein
LRLSEGTAAAVIALKLSEAVSKTLCTVDFALLELHSSSSKLFCSSDIGWNDVQDLQGGCTSTQG